jgi:hypothetical protein
MSNSHRILLAILGCSIFLLLANSSFAEIFVGTLTKEKAKEKYGITMHSRKNGDAGIKVWVEFKREGWLEKFTYTELRMSNAKGGHLVSAKLQPNPVHHRQPKNVTTVAFPVALEQLSQCSFLVVCYGGNEGEFGYCLNGKDFLDVSNSILALRALHFSSDRLLFVFVSVTTDE